MPPPIGPFAFTLQFPSKVDVLRDTVGVSEAHSPESDVPEPLVSHFRAIWDTGASASVISQQVIAELNLYPIDKTKVLTANGERIANVYLVHIYLRNKVSFSGVRVTDGNLLGTSILIGMDIIGSGDFAVTHSDGKTCMSFQLPSSRKIDFVKEMNAKNMRGPGQDRIVKRNNDDRPRVEGSG